MDDSGQQHRALALAWGALALCVVGVWANAIGGGPIFDDHFLVTRQTCFKTLEGMLRTLRFETDYACTYRPLRYLSYGVDHAIFGDRFWGYHVGNIARHVVVTFALGLLATRVFADAGGRDTPSAQDRWAALAVAALWALHPVQTDSVSYVSGRRDILAGGWTIVSVYAALVAQRRGGLWWLVPLWTTLFAFLSKESAVVIPVLFLMWTIRDAELKRWVREHVAVVVSVGVGLFLSFLLVLYRGVFASHSNRAFEWWGGSIESNFATVATLQVHYVRHVLLSHPLIGDYRPDTIALAEGFGDPRAIAGVLVVVGILALALWLRRRRPIVAFGLLWYLVSLSPVSHVFPHHELFAEHYLYIPLVGLALAAVDAARWALSFTPDPARGVLYGRVVLGAVLVVMGLRVVDRNRDFADEQAFYEAVVEHAPNNLRAIANLGYIYADAGEHEAAVFWLERLREAWEPGSRDERNALPRLIEAARGAGRPALALRAAAQLAANHPDIGFGHRQVAELRFAGGDAPGAFAAAADYYATTRGEGGLLIMARAASRAPGLDARPLIEAVADAPHAPEEAVFGAARALASGGDEPAAFELLRARAASAPSPAYLAFLCDLGGRVAAEPLEACAGR